MAKKGEQLKGRRFRNGDKSGLEILENNAEKWQQTEDKNDVKERIKWW